MRIAAAGKFKDTMDEISIATVNIKFDGESAKPVPIPSHGVIPPSKRGKSVYDQLPWAERRSRMIDALVGQGSLHIVGFQVHISFSAPSSLLFAGDSAEGKEVLHNQLLDIAQLLGPTFSHVGVGRDDGKEAGEYSPIFFDNSKFDKVDSKYVWLSPHPDVPGSRGWDANLTRIATLLTLSIKATGEKLTVVNTHYDDAGVRARAESSLLLRKAVHKWVKDGEKGVDGQEGAVIFMGDLNSPPDEEGYQNLISDKPLRDGNPSLSFVDSFTHLSTRSTHHPSAQSAPTGPIHTFSDFLPPQSTRVSKRIDFIMLAKSASDATKPRGQWTVGKYACVDNFVDGDESGWVGRWSDHRAVRVVLERGS